MQKSGLQFLFLPPFPPSAPPWSSATRRSVSLCPQSFSPTIYCTTYGKNTFLCNYCSYFNSFIFTQRHSHCVGPVIRYTLTFPCCHTRFPHPFIDCFTPTFTIVLWFSSHGSLYCPSYPRDTLSTSEAPPLLQAVHIPYLLHPLFFSQTSSPYLLTSY